MRPGFHPSRLAVLALICVASALAIDPKEEAFHALCLDRAVIERVYHLHRQNVREPFEKAVPFATIRRLVKLDLRNEKVLSDFFSVHISEKDIQEEVHRIDATTRDVSMLSEIKQALGNDPSRFARSIARPIVVERLLRQHFDSNESLHSRQRSRAAKAREHWMTTRGKPLSERINAVKAEDDLRVEKIEWSVLNQSPPVGSPRDSKPSFTNLPAELQRVLRLQLKEEGDVSAVIEDGRHFQVFLCTKSTPQALAVCACILPKLSLDAWLESISPLNS